jgi:hypothetical protein
MEKPQITIPIQSTKRPARVKLVAYIVFLVIIAFYYGYARNVMARNDTDSIKTKVAADMQDMNNRAAEDAVQKYEIVARQGDKRQMYWQARRCAAAYLEAKDEANYDKWKATEDELDKEIHSSHSH